MRYTNRQKITNWREDAAGLLTVTVVVLKEGVYPYLSSEIDDPLPEHMSGMTEIMQYIPLDAFTPEALKTLEGKAATITRIDDDAHEWRTPENAMKDGLTVGAAAGSAWVESDEIRLKFLIQDADTIADIKNGKLVEVSAAYSGSLTFEDGDFNGKPYQAKQGNFEFNHVLFLPEGEGRLGKDARILNSKGEKMSHTLKVKVKNKTRTYRFTNEADREEAEKMVNETQEEMTSMSAEEINNAMDQIKNLNDEIKAKNQELDEAKAKVEEYAAKLNEVLNPEMQEQLAEELLEQANDEEAIIDAEVAEDDKEEVKNQVKNAKGRSERRKVIVSHILNKRGTPVGDNWTDDGIGAAFITLAASAKEKIKNDPKRMAPSGQPFKNKGSSGDAYARMTAFRNKGEK